MAKWHIYPDEGGCKLGHRGLVASASDFRGLIASSRCAACERLAAAKLKRDCFNAAVDALLAPRVTPPVVTSVEIRDEDYLLLIARYDVAWHARIAAEGFRWYGSEGLPANFTDAQRLYIGADGAWLVAHLEHRGDDLFVVREERSA